MADTLPTIWPIEPHTTAKHKILRGYLDAWFPILARHPKTERVLYVDGFAGPGEYDGGEDGSPVIAIKAVLEHSHSFNSPIRLVFIEKNPERHANLCRVIESYRHRFGTDRGSIQIMDPICGSCEDQLNSALSVYEKKRKNFGPALVFLDQFGYSDVPLDLIVRIMAHDQCEVLSYLHGEGIKRFIEDPTKHNAITRAFGGDSWRPALNLPVKNRISFLADEYKKRLKGRAGVKYVWHFSMHGDGNKLLYWLFFCTNHRRGLEVMKNAMGKVDASGGQFSFSDASSPSQLVLFNSYSPQWLASHLLKQFSGREMAVQEIFDYVLESTPGTTYKSTLRSMEEAMDIEVLNAPPGRRRGTFPNEQIRIRFRKL